MPVAGLIALLGDSVGAGPVSADSVVACLTIGIGMSRVHGVVGGLAHVPQPVVPVRQLPLPQLAYTRELRPFLATIMPVLAMSPMRIMSRRVTPALINSCRFLKAWYISFHSRRETRSPFALKYTPAS